ncbi:hypothetical protein ES703_29866 [subsurface metagenome]
MTWGDIGLIAGALVVFSVVAGIISAWWEDRKWKRDKTKGG